MKTRKIDGDGDMLINLHSVDPLLQRKPCPNKPILFIDYLTLGLFFFFIVLSVILTIYVCKLSLVLRMFIHRYTLKILKML